MKHLSIIGAVIFIFLCVELTFFYQSKQGIQSPVEIAKVEVKAESDGYLKEFDVKISDKVEAGQALAIIDKPQLKKELNKQAEAVDDAIVDLEVVKNMTFTEERIVAEKLPMTKSSYVRSSNNLAEAKARYDHFKQLMQEGIIAKKQLAEAESAYRMALAQSSGNATVSPDGTVTKVVKVQVKAPQEEIDAFTKDVEELQKKVDHTLDKFDNMIIFSPFQGIVSKINFKNGELIKKGQTLLVVENQRDCWVKFNLPNKKADRLSLGQVVHLKSPSLPDKTFTGTIEQIKPQSKMSKNVKIKLLNDDLLLNKGTVIIYK